MNTKEQMELIGRQAKKASADLVKIGGGAVTRAINRLAELLGEERQSLAEANRKDLQAAEAQGLDAPKLKRLRLTDKVVDAMIQGCREVAAMDDPVGEIESMRKIKDGMLVGRMRMPLGVVCMIFESRPNVTVDAAILCLRAGDAVILRGGSEAFHSNMALAALIHRALEESGLPREAVQVPPTTDRAAVAELLKLDQYIDVAIPRGGEGLIRAVADMARMPVLKHYKGVCHIYIDDLVVQEKAVEIVRNAKVQSPGVCNALECLLVHEAVAGEILPKIAERLGAEGVRFKACPKSLPLLGEYAEPAADEDWGREFLDLILAVKVVKDQDEAQAHIAQYGSNHTEAILSEEYSRCMRFLREVDASLVVVNASTRFNDGGQLGLGAEIGISTSKLHAYGPMGVRELTSSKFVLLGQGQIRD
ncbi:MAG: glutamate-5-semialdehyde dehydrogenase [Desulfovibrionales bacterium]|nr:glutamate-5-semialdehyde dehydrogenase [Desulfovibrionales bacterium]